MHQDATWYAGRPQPRRLCVQWGPSYTQKKGTPTTTKFLAHVYCRQTAGCIKTPLGMEVGLSQGDFVLDGDPAPSPKSGRSPPIFGPCLLRPNGCMDQDATWYGGTSRPRRLCVRWRPSYPQEKGHTHFHLIFGPCLLWPNGLMDEDVTWYGSRPRHRPHCIRHGSSYPRKGLSSPPLFSPMSIVAMVAHLSCC